MLFSPKLPAQTMELLCTRLRMAYGVGIRIDRALELLTETKNQRLYRACEPLVAAIRQGDTLEVALRSNSRSFPQPFIETVAAGERSGTLVAMFETLCTHYEARRRMKRQVFSSLLYPVILLPTAFVLIMWVFKPLMIELYTGGSFSNLVWGWMIMLLQALVLVLILFALGRMGILDRMWNTVMTRLWPFSRDTYRFRMARFLRTMGLLWDSGYDSKQCLIRAVDTLEFPKMEKQLRKAIRPLHEGRSLEEALASTNCLPPEVVSAVSTGEGAGEVGTTLRGAADDLERTAAHRLGNFLLMLEGIALLTLVALYFSGPILMLVLRAL
jgi:type II secretory pathway component PulF